MRTTIGLVDSTHLGRLTAEIGRRLLVKSTSVLPFLEFDDFLPELLKLLAHGRQRLVCGGHVTPDLLIAADKAEMRVQESLGVSPFALDASPMRAAVTSPSDILYVANPNRVTGANLGLADLKYLAEAVPDGFLILDEYYFDYYGISGVALLEKHSNVIIIRSLSASYGLGTAEAGFVVASPTIIEHLTERLDAARVSPSKYQDLLNIIENNQALSVRLRTMHDEMLRVSTLLTRMGIQNRITAADFLLLRVASPTSAGNYLAQYRVPFDNLDGYPQLKNYLRYRIQSEADNDALIKAFSKMPADYYRMVGVDNRSITLRRPAERVSFERSGSSTGLSERLSSRTRRVAETVAK